MLSRRRLAPAAAAALCLSTAAAAWAQDGRLQQYLGLARATQAQPVTSAEIEAALLSADGVEDLARLFEQALAEKVTVAGAPVTPELGGEATLEHGVIRFVSYPDPLHALVRRMLELRDQPRALLRLASGSAEGRHVLEKTGGLHALLYQMTTREPRDADRRALERVMDAAVALHFKTWNVTPETQRAAILRHDWTGRYVGFWHLHPPQPGAGGYGPGLEPSHEDMAIAVEKGQMLTVVFQPDGFDAWDLAPLAAAGRPDLSTARVVRHRSPVWEERFRDGRR